MFQAYGCGCMCINLKLPLDKFIGVICSVVIQYGTSLIFAQKCVMIGAVETLDFVYIFDMLKCMDLR